MNAQTAIAVLSVPRCIPPREDPQPKGINTEVAEGTEVTERVVRVRKLAAPTAA
jgi:hypothetical protein